MTGAPVPIRTTLAHVLKRHEQRIHSLEQRALAPVGAIAFYILDVSGPTPAPTWAVNFAAATAIIDTFPPTGLGCKPISGGLQIPSDTGVLVDPSFGLQTRAWWWVATLALVISTSSPATGEALVWSAVNTGNVDSVPTGVHRADVLLDGTQVVSATLAGITEFGNPAAAEFGLVSSSAGTDFAGLSATIAVQALGVGQQGYPGGGGVV